jgi:hypothetical protein
MNNSNGAFSYSINEISIFIIYILVDMSLVLASYNGNGPEG